METDLNSNLMWSMGLIGAIGGMAIKAVADVIVAFIRRRKSSHEDSTSDTISNLLKDSEKLSKRNQGRS
jgi:aspartate/glutamate racemase